jgi:hypothetical protein
MSSCPRVRMGCVGSSGSAGVAAGSRGGEEGEGGEGLLDGVVEDPVDASECGNDGVSRVSYACSEPRPLGVRNSVSSENTTMNRSSLSPSATAPSATAGAS